jgi:hypothetical protein
MTRTKEILMLSSSKRIGLLSVAVAILAVGCFKHTYSVGNGGGDTGRAPNYSQWSHHWFLGLIGGEEPMDVKGVCPGGNATIRDVHTFVDQLIGAFTGIVWRPTTVEVWCGEGGATSSVTLTPEQLRAIGQDARTVEFVKTVDAAKAAELARINQK